MGGVTTITLPAQTLGQHNGPQILTLQPMVGQGGQQFFLQGNPGDPPIQLLLQSSPAGTLGTTTLVPVVQKQQVSI